MTSSCHSEEPFPKGNEEPTRFFASLRMTPQWHRTLSPLCACRAARYGPGTSNYCGGRVVPGDCHARLGRARMDR